MTLHETLEMVRQVGEVEIRGGNRRLKYPEKDRVRLQPAIATLRECKAEALALLAENSPAAEASAEMAKTSQDTSKVRATPIPAQTAKSAPATSGDSAETDAEPSPEELAHAAAVLSRAGVRLMRIGGVDMVGIWSDLDAPEVRAALRTYGSGQLPVRYLDGDGIPMRYKLRKVPGEPASQCTCRNGAGTFPTVGCQRPNAGGNGLEPEWDPVGGVESRGAEPALCRARHSRAVGPHRRENRAAWRGAKGKLK